MGGKKKSADKAEKSNTLSLGKKKKKQNLKQLPTAEVQVNIVYI